MKKNKKKIYWVVLETLLDGTSPIFYSRETRQEARTFVNSTLGLRDAYGYAPAVKRKLIRVEV